MKTFRQDFPNDAFIHRILNSLKNNTPNWNSAYALIHNKYDEFWNSLTLTKEQDEYLHDLQFEAWEITHQDNDKCSAWEAAYDAFYALIAYDDCAYMLDSDPGELELLAAFGDSRAILLLPACTALSWEEK